MHGLLAAIRIYIFIVNNTATGKPLKTQAAITAVRGQVLKSGNCVWQL